MFIIFCHCLIYTLWYLLLCLWCILYLFFNTVVYLTCSCSACLSACELSFKSLCCICLIFMPACINSVLVWRLRSLHVNMTFTIYLLHGTTYLLPSYMLSLFSFTLCGVCCPVLWYSCTCSLILWYTLLIVICSACLSACELSFKSRCCICLIIMPACIIRLSRLETFRLLYVNMTFTIYLLYGITYLLRVTLCVFIVFNF